MQRFDDVCHACDMHGSVATRAAAPTTVFLMISQMVNRLHAHTTDRVHGRYSYMAKDDTLSGQGGAKDALFAFIELAGCCYRHAGYLKAQRLRADLRCGERKLG